MKTRRILNDINAGGSVIAAPTAIVMAVAVVLATAAPELLRDDKTSEIDEVIMERLVEQLSDSFLGTGIGRDGSTSWEDLDDIENNLAYPGFGIDDDFEYLEDEDSGTRTDYYAIDDLIVTKVSLINITVTASVDDDFRGGSGGGDDMGGGGDTPPPEEPTHSYVQFMVMNDDPNNIADNEGFEYRVRVSPYNETTGKDWLVDRDNITDYTITEKPETFHSGAFERCPFEFYTVTVTVSPLPRESIGDFNWTNNAMTLKVGTDTPDAMNKAPAPPWALNGAMEVILLPYFDAESYYPDYVLQKDDGERCTHLADAYSSSVYGVNCSYSALVYDLEGDLVQLRFDWNAVPAVDAVYTEGQPPYDQSKWYPIDKNNGEPAPVPPLTEPWAPTYISKMYPGFTAKVPKLWTEPGTYYLKAQARDFPYFPELEGGQESEWSEDIHKVKVMTPEDFAKKYLTEESIISTSLSKLNLEDSDDEEPPDPPTGMEDDYLDFGAQILFHVALVEPKHQIIYQENIGEVEAGLDEFGGDGFHWNPDPPEDPGTGGDTGTGSTSDPTNPDTSGANTGMNLDEGEGDFLGEGGNAAGDCLAEGTMILMADGKTKTIETLEHGDKVLSFDYSKQMNIESTIVEVFEIIKKGIHDINDGLLQVTGSHPILAQKSDGKIGWTAVNSLQSNAVYNKHASKLELGDYLLTSSGRWVEVKSIEYKPGEIKTYNFGVDVDAHNYYANDILVSNSGDYELGGQSEGSTKISSERNTRATAPVINYQKIVKFGQITDSDRIGKILGIPGYIHFRIYVNMELNGRWTNILDWPDNEIDAENKVEYQTNVLIYNSLGNRQYTLHQGVLGIEISKGGIVKS